jgi:hypothetical protein
MDVGELQKGKMKNRPEFSGLLILTETRFLEASSHATTSTAAHISTNHNSK